MTPGGQRVEQITHRILSSGEFRHQPSVVQRVVDDIGRWLSNFVTGLSGGGGGIASVVAILIVVLAAVGIAFVAVKLVTGRRSRVGDEVGPALRAEPAAAEWTERARAAERAGQWKEALRCYYRALVLRLSSVGLLDEVPGRTTGEHRAQLGRSVPDAREEFSEMTDEFERAWYADMPVGPDNAERTRELSDKVAGKALP